MKILFIAPNYFPHIGGVERHINEVSSELIKDGHQVTVMVVNHDNQYLNYEREVNNLEIIRYETSNFSIKRKINIVIHILKFFSKFITSDIIHFHDYGTFWSLGILLYPIYKIFRKRLYITFHGWEGDIPPKKSTKFKRKICEVLTKGNMCVGAFIEKWYGTNADVITYGGAHRVSIVKDIGDYILFLGRISNDTGVYDYVKAWKNINKLYPDLKLMICGDGQLKGGIEELIVKEDIKNICFKGFVSNPESFIENAKVVLTSGYLGILEAFSYKKSVVAVYDNELKKDYLEMIPNSTDMMWIVKGIDQILISVIEAMENNEKREKAYRFSLENSWEKVKIDYYKLWGMI